MYKNKFNFWISEKSNFINSKWFTLVELIVWITISMLLMMSVGIFVSTWMKNITLQSKVIDENKKISSDFLYISKILWNSEKYITTTATWILLKQNKHFDKWWYSYIWVKEFDKTYCWEWENTKTNHLFVNNFIPYQEIWENINSNFSDILTSETSNYKSDALNHQIYKKISWNWEVVVWKDIFWDKFTEWSFWTWVFLNSPTWIIEIWTKVIFSDTLNDRILYLSGSQVYKLLDEKDWLEEPTWLVYDSSEGSLYIANSAKWEVLKFSSKKYLTNPELKVENISKNNISKLEIEILETSENLTNPILNSKFSFNNISSNSSDFVSLENNKINYYFLNNYNSNQTRVECSWKNSWDIILNYPTNSIKCTNNTWSWELTNFRSVNFNNTELIINNIQPLLTENKNYYVKIFNEKYFPYFIQWDDDIFTLEDNTLEVYQTWLNYPTWLRYSWWSLQIKEFEPTNFISSNFNSYDTDFIFSNPIKKLEKVITWTSLLNFKLDYYKYLNCFNLDEKIERTFLLKKDF